MKATINGEVCFIRWDYERRRDTVITRCVIFPSRVVDNNLVPAWDESYSGSSKLSKGDQHCKSKARKITLLRAMKDDMRLPREKREEVWRQYDEQIGLRK